MAEADLVVVGGPTHAHGMSHDSTRHAAVEAIAEPESVLVTKETHLESDEVARAWGERLARLASTG